MISTSVSKYLLSEVNNLDVNIVNSSKNTALHNTVWCGNDNGYTELHWACIKNNVVDVLRLAYISGHSINVQDNNGYTPLHEVCYNGHNEIVETLMLAGADETMTNDHKQTLAQVARIKGHN